MSKEVISKIESATLERIGTCQFGSVVSIKPVVGESKRAVLIEDMRQPIHMVGLVTLIDGWLCGSGGIDVGRMCDGISSVVLNQEEITPLFRGMTLEVYGNILDRCQREFENFDLDLDAKTST